jgi:hypothetical protein
MLNVLQTNRKSTLLKRGVKDLNLTNPGEIFVLECIINNHHLNNYVVKYIEKIKLENGLITVVMTTSKASNNFSVSNINGGGWSKDVNQYEKESYVSHDIAHKTAYR